MIPIDASDSKKKDSNPLQTLNHLETQEHQYQPENGLRSKKKQEWKDSTPKTKIQEEKINEKKKEFIFKFEGQGERVDQLKHPRVISSTQFGTPSPQKFQKQGTNQVTMPSTNLKLESHLAIIPKRSDDKKFSMQAKKLTTLEVEQEELSYGSFRNLYQSKNQTGTRNEDKRSSLFHQNNHRTTLNNNNSNTGNINETPNSRLKESVHHSDSDHSLIEQAQREQCGAEEGADDQPSPVAFYNYEDDDELSFIRQLEVELLTPDGYGGEQRRLQNRGGISRITEVSLELEASELHPLQSVSMVRNEIRIFAANENRSIFG